MSAYLSHDYVALRPTASVADLLTRLGEEDRAEAVLTDANGTYQGVVRLQDAMNQPEDQALSALARRDGVVFDASTSLWEGMIAMRDFIGEAVPLVADNGRLLGVVPESAVIGAYLEAVHDLRREENAAA
jgi:CIC family chloride channel protein